MQFALDCKTREMLIRIVSRVVFAGLVFHLCYIIVVSINYIVRYLQCMSADPCKATSLSHNDYLEPSRANVFLIGDRHGIATRGMGVLRGGVGGGGLVAEGVCGEGGGKGVCSGVGVRGFQ